MSLTISKQHDVTVVAFGSDYKHIGEDRIPDVESVVFEVAETADPPLVVVDLSQTSLFSSAFLASLIRIWCRLHSRDGGTFAVSGLAPRCERMVQVACLDQFFGTFESKDEAVGALCGLCNSRR